MDDDEDNDETVLSVAAKKKKKITKTFSLHVYCLGQIKNLVLTLRLKCTRTHRHLKHTWHIRQARQATTKAAAAK